MSATENTVYLVTGANRGIGRALTTHLLARPNTTVIAATRSPSSPTSQSLASFPKAPSSLLISVKIDSSSETDAQAAIQELQKEHGIKKLDVVIANSGICGTMVPARELDIKDYKEVLEVNVVGPLVLFQAVRELLLASKGDGMGKEGKGKFVVVSSEMGSMEMAEGYPAWIAGYGSSKAAVNFLVKRIWAEEEGLVAVCVHPGWVQTDMGNGGARDAGMEQAPVTIAESIEGVMKEIDEAERGDCAKFASFDHKGRPW